MNMMAAVAGRPATHPMTQDGTLAQIAYDRISAAIVDGRLDLGEPLSEAELAKALGMSKAPVRMAIGALRQRGLVEIVPQSGTYVFSPTREQIVAISEFRFLLEEQAVRLAMARDTAPLLAALETIVAAMEAAWRAGDAMAVKRLDTDFHWAFVRYAGNPYLEAAYADIAPLVEALRYRFMDTAGYRNQAYEEHRAMLRLLAAGRTDKAASLLGEHVQRTKQFQANVDWSSGRSRRKFYRTRDYRLLLAAGDDAG